MSKSRVLPTLPITSRETAVKKISIWGIVHTYPEICENPNFFYEYG